MELQAFFDRVPNYQFVMFDLDGTLVDSVPGLYLAVQRMLSDLSYPKVTEQQVRTWVGNGVPALIQRALLGDIKGNLPGQVDDVLFQKAKPVFDRHYMDTLTEGCTLYPGVELFLNSCMKRGWPMAVVTNKSIGFAEPMIARLGIADYFSVVVGGDTLEQKKPDPEPLKYIADQLGMPVETGLMVGDSRNDIQAAKEAGCDCLAVTYGYNHGRPVAEDDPDFYVDSLELVCPGLV